MCAAQILTQKELATQQEWMISTDILNLQRIHENIQVIAELFLDT